MSEAEEGPTMRQVVKVVYDMKPSPLLVHYGQQMAEKRIVGHKCPDCSFVYVPPKGYCPMCVVPTGDADEVEVEARGTVTSFTVINPIQYHGQEEKDVYVLASVLLDGASMTLGQQRIGEVLPKQVRTGMRVEAEWTRTAGAWGIAHWGPNGEADLPPEQVKGHVL
jgi:uncharacterized OB-fold protein